MILDVIMRYLLVAFLIMNVIKWCYFGRTFDILQEPLYMIMETGKGMAGFLLLLMLFSATFSLSNIAIGVDDPGTDVIPFRTALFRHIM